jgi:hypothetical protein
MYKIILPIRFNGTRYGVKFKDYIGYTRDKELAEKMSGKGYKVEEIDKEDSDMALSALNREKARLEAIEKFVKGKAEKGSPGGDKKLRGDVNKKTGK